MAPDRAFDAQLVEVLRSPDFRAAVIQRLVAASLDATEGDRVLDLAIDRVREEARGRAFQLATRILRAVDAACADYADLRCLPYRKVVAPLVRRWPTILSFARQAGLTEEEAYAVIRDLLRKNASHWARVADIDHELVEELRYGFAVISLAKGHGMRLTGAESCLQTV